MNTKEKLAALREEMARQQVAAVIVPSSDPHQSEYTAAHWQARQWLTGFTGSAGTAVVTLTHACLWTDFRYWIQAASQMDGFELFKQGACDVPAFEQWLADTLAAGDRVALDGCLVSVSQARKYKKKFDRNSIELDTSLDIVSGIWADRPAMPATNAYALDVKFAGKGRCDKLDLIRQKMKAAGADTYLMTILEDIAWTFNLRGDDIHTNPVNLAFALVGLESATLFINPDKLDQTLAGDLNADGIAMAPYDGVDNALKSLGDGHLLVDPETVNDHLLCQVSSTVTCIEAQSPATWLKCQKNEVEIDHIRDTVVKDGRAVVNFLYWLAHETGPVSEISAAEKLFELRTAQPDFMDVSFDSIMACDAHSAMCHYSATTDTDAALTRESMFLTDSGGNYLTGTTDITRTLHLGRPGTGEKTDYTLVLKGHIAVARARFPSGTRGYQIDTLARQFLWQQGLDFGHGTGHGVGFFLCVHEGPARISPYPVDEPLKPGMLLTNEPGLYREGAYGIRLENMILVTDDVANDFGRFLKFETLTLCHFERDLIDVQQLTADEIKWVNDYHQVVYERLAPGLAPDVAAWLGSKTRAI